MIIGIDGNEANVDRRVGISEYAYELINQFSRLSRKDIQFRIYLKSQPLDHMPKASEGFEYLISGPSKLWTQFGLPLKLFSQNRKPDVFFTPSHYAPRFSPIPTVISIMDVSYLRFPDMFRAKDLGQLKSWTAYSARKASLIFTISKSSKNDIISEYNLPENKVVVTYPGVKPNKDKISVKDVKKKYSIDGDFVLFVGTLQPRKNIKKLVEAFSKISDKNIKLVVVGKKGWQYEEILSSPKEFGIEDRVLFLDFVPDEDLISLYSDAKCYVLPSLYEGFGLPILEAMKYGCPVITSNVSSMPEAGGDAAIYVDPADSSDIAEKIDKVLSDDKLREDMRKKGYEQVKKFSWEDTASQTLKALEGLSSK